MDPKETLLQCLRAIDAKEWSEAIDRLNDYYQWRVRGGFAPTDLPTDVRADLYHGDTFADHCAARLSQALIHQVTR